MVLYVIEGYDYSMKTPINFFFYQLQYNISFNHVLLIKWVENRKFYLIICKTIFHHQYNGSHNVFVTFLFQMLISLSIYNAKQISYLEDNKMIM